MLDNKRIESIANFGSYKARFVIRRILIVAVAAILIIRLAMFFTNTESISISHQILAYLIVALAYTTVSEVTILVVMLMRRIDKIKHRIIPQALLIIITTFFLALFWTKVAERLFDNSELLSHNVTRFSILLGIIMLVLMHILVMMSNITREWMESRKEVERLKRAKLLSDYNSLQDRLNPHFLFNNLSVLKSLIRYNPEDAETFTQNFTDVYRYLLRSHENQTVSVKNELEFLGAYVALHKERLGKGIDVALDINDEDLSKELPPMSIQLLVENAIKHNVVSKLKPLHISISSDEGSLTVKNKINKKATTYSTHTGLKTLKAQYQLISNREVIVEELDDEYRVTVPLL